MTAENLGLEQGTTRSGAAVVLEDVRQAVNEIAGGDPTAVGAGKIREHLGRGSVSTIQKLITALREAKRNDEALPDEDENAAPVPDAVRLQSEGVILSMWQGAVALAENRVRARLDAVTSERDTWRGRAEDAHADRDGLCQMIDAKDAALAAAAEAAEAAAQAAQAAKKEMELQIERIAAEAAEHADQVREMEHQAELAALKWDVERQTLRGLNSELQDKLRNVELERDKILQKIELKPQPAGGPGSPA